jgi:hypothetical protein
MHSTSARPMQLAARARQRPLAAPSAVARHLGAPSGGSAGVGCDTLVATTDSPAPTSLAPTSKHTAVVHFPVSSRVPYSDETRRGRLTQTGAVAVSDPSASLTLSSQLMKYSRQPRSSWRGDDALLVSPRVFGAQSVPTSRSVILGAVPHARCADAYGVSNGGAKLCRKGSRPSAWWGNRHAKGRSERRVDHPDCSLRAEEGVFAGARDDCLA